MRPGWLVSSMQCAGASKSRSGRFTRISSRWTRPVAAAGEENGGSRILSVSGEITATRQYGARMIPGLDGVGATEERRAYVFVR